MTTLIRLHATCVARDDDGVLLLGPPGAGKSDLALRLLARGFTLVADDQVLIENGVARPPPALAGLLEVRGLGILRRPFLETAKLVIAVELTVGDRLPEPARHESLGLPLVRLRAEAASAPDRVALALECALGRIDVVAGAFTP